jgi:predicted nucleic acid-binding protein
VESAVVGLILDSSFIIAGERRGRTALQILQDIRATQGEIDVGISVVTIAELTHGAYRSKTDNDRLRRLSFIEELCRDVPIHPITLEIGKDIGRIEGQRAAQGISLSFEDLAIGVTALHLGFDVATLNIRHFQKIPGLKIVSPLS